MAKPSLVQHYDTASGLSRLGDKGEHKPRRDVIGATMPKCNYDIFGYLDQFPEQW
jgi:hypothetical protein